MRINQFNSKYLYQGSKELFDKDLDKLKKNLSKKDWLVKHKNNYCYFYQLTSTRGYLKVDVKLSFNVLSENEIDVELTPYIDGGVLFAIGLLIPVNSLLIFINTQNETFNKIKYFYPLGAAILALIYLIILYNFYSTVKEVIIEKMRLKKID